MLDCSTQVRCGGSGTGATFMRTCLRHCRRTLLFDIRHSTQGMRRNRRLNVIRQNSALFPMMRSLALPLSLCSAPRVRQSFMTPHVWSWQHQLSAQVFAGVVRAKGHGVGHEHDGPLHVSVTETELSKYRADEGVLAARSVLRSPRHRAWRASWYENQTTEACVSCHRQAREEGHDGARRITCRPSCSHHAAQREGGRQHEGGEGPLR